MGDEITNPRSFAIASPASKPQMMSFLPPSKSLSEMPY
jgi:hypothetical protein